MKISTETITILKNFGAFNPHLVVEAGSKLQTINEKKTQFITATITEEFPVDFALHDLPGFLKIVALFEDPDFEFGESSVVISDVTASQEYFYSDKDDLTYTTKTPPVPMGDIEFTLTDEILKKILKAAAANKVEDVSFVGDGALISIQSLDKENPKRVFSVGLVESDAEFKVFIKHSKKGNKLNFLPLDYVVNIADAGVIRFIAKVEDIEVTYLMAIETDSVFG